ncbi:MAG: 2-dehydro-3-deoxyphosphogluconate aldolase [Bacillota bacterium]|nr:MAG: 2-dehydro-3-deoxyphosphogluconate aldolase [Bacillota bacterium]
MDKVLQKIEQYKIVPVVTIQKIGDAAEMLEGLVKGSLPVAEICFRTDCAEEAIKLAIKKYPEMLVGAGTVINREQCERAIKAGAKFIVSPGLSKEVAKVCREKEIPYLPGVVTPTDIMKALSLGLIYLKFFPAGSFGGLNTIKALSAAFPQVRFMPTGGVCLENMNEYLAFPKIFACGGSWMMKGNAEEIEQNTRAAVAAFHAANALL